MALHRFVLVGNLAEAKLDAESRTAEVTVIRKGWSQNGFYYTDAALESIAKLINAEAERVFLDHNKRSEIFEPRSLEDHIANNMPGMAKVTDDGRVVATAKFFESGPNEWIFDRMLETPHTFGPSIVGKAKIHKGVAEGKRGPIVDAVTWLHSYDIVARPSAGGKINDVKEVEGAITPTNNASEFVHISEGLGTELEDSVDDSLFEDFDMENVPTSEAESLKDQIKRIRQRKETMREWWDLESVFMNSLSNLVLAQGDFEFTSVVERRKFLPGLIEEFSKEVLKLKFVEARALPKEEKEDVDEAIRTATSDNNEIKIILYKPREFENHSFSRITISKEKGIGATVGKPKGSKGKRAIRSYHFDVSKGWTVAKAQGWISRNVRLKSKTKPNQEGVRSMENIKTLTELKAQEPALYEAILAEAVVVAEAQEKIAGYKTDSETLKGVKEELDTVKKELADLKGSSEKAVTENTGLKKSVENYKKAEADAEKASMIAEVKKDVGLEEENCSEQFNADLAACDFGDKDKFKVAVRARIEDRFALVKGRSVPRKKVIEGNGPPKTSSDNSDSKVPNDKEAAALLKS